MKMAFQYKISIFLGLVIFLLVIFSLNLGNILPISKLSTQRQVNLSCPVELDPCPKGEVISGSTKVLNFQGLGYSNLDSGASIKSILSGTLEVDKEESSEGVEDILNVRVSDPSKDLVAEYRFKGNLAEGIKGKTQISQGEIVGSLTGEVIGSDSFGKSSHSLVVSVSDPKDQKYLKLQSDQTGLTTPKSETSQQIVCKRFEIACVLDLSKQKLEAVSKGIQKLTKIPGFTSKEEPPQSETVEESIILKKGLNYPCPVEADKCLAKKIKTTRDNPNFRGLGFIGLKTRTNIKAVAAGKVEITSFTTPQGEEIMSLQISDDLNKVEIIYRFKEGKLDKNLKDGVEVSKGQILATLSDKVFTRYFEAKPYNLIVLVIDQENQEILPIVPNKNGFSI